MKRPDLNHFSLITLMLGLFFWCGAEVEAAPSFLNQLKREVSPLMPETLRESLNEINLKESDLGSLPLGCDSNHHRVFGRFKADTIEINQGLEKWYLLDSALDCYHGSSRKVALATLIHELVHAWEEKNFQKLPSRSRAYIDLIHAKKSLVGPIKILNQKTDRLPDAYELKNSREHFAINVEYFLLDETYKCRRPNLYEYFGKLFDFYPNANCKPNNRIKIFEKGSVTSFKAYDLSLENVRGIHFVRSGRGEKAMSRFGHAGFRLLTCDRELSDEQCLRATHQHLYVNFVARVEEGFISNSDGMTGKYPIHLEFLNFKDTLKKYTEVSEREVYSYPLKMTDEEKLRFINQVLTLYWEYAGRYYFSSKNCATEALRLLKATYGPRYPNIRFAFKITPKALGKLLVDYKLLEEQPVILKQKGFFFPSSKEVIQRLFQKVANHFDNGMTYKEFFQWPITQRSDFYLQQNFKRTDSLVFAALEKHRLKRSLAALENTLSAKLYELESEHPLFKKSQRLFQIENLLKYGIDETSGYGIFQEIDGKREHEFRHQELKAERASLEAAIQEWSAETLESQWSQVQASLDLLRALLAP